MAAATLTMRIDSNLKREAAAVAEYYGFDLSGVTRAFYKQMVRDHAMKAAEEVIAKGGTGHRFNSAEEMMMFLEKEVDE